MNGISIPRFLLHVGMVLGNGFLIAVCAIFDPWWLAVPLCIINAALAAYLLHSLVNLIYWRAKYETYSELLQNGAQHLAAHVVQEITSKAPFN